LHFGGIQNVATEKSKKAVTAADKIELGRKYLTELNYTEAVASFTEAIGLDPENIPAYMGRAEAYVGLKQYDDAKADYIIMQDGSSNVDFSKVISLNQTSAMLWQEIENKEFDTDSVTEALTSRYDVDNESARRDAQKFIDSLDREGIIE